jgi:hypothetical protein
LIFSGILPEVLGLGLGPKMSHGMKIPMRKTIVDFYLLHPRNNTARESDGVDWFRTTVFAGSVDVRK